MVPTSRDNRGSTVIKFCSCFEKYFTCSLRSGMNYLLGLEFRDLFSNIMICLFSGLLDMNIGDPYSPHDVAGRESDRFQADVTSLSEMFPTCDDKTLRDYLRMFRDDPNYKARISNLLLDRSSGLDQGISIVHEHVGNFQEKGSVNQQTERGRDTLQIGAGIDKSVVSIDIDKSENSNVCSSAEVVENLQCGNVEVLDEDVCNIKKVISSKQSVEPPIEEISCSSETDDDLVFIKSVPSPGKRPFHRTFHRTNSGLSSESEERGICIRYKDGAPHPSMKKARKSEVVVIDDELNDGICNQSPNENTNSRCHPVDRESSSSCNKSASSVTAISDGDVDDRSQLRDTIVSGSKTNGTGSNEAVLIRGNQVSSSNCVAVSDPSLLDDFESLKKVCMLSLMYCRCSGMTLWSSSCDILVILV